MGNERGASSSRKGRKSKPPQRGLGVAQLESIRLYGQMGCGYHPSLHGPYPANDSFYMQEDMRVLQPTYSSTCYGFHCSMMMGVEEYETRPNIRYGDFPPRATSSWNITRNSAQQNLTRQFLNLHHAEDSVSERTKEQESNSLGSSSQNSESQELDLELKLSL